MKKIITYEMTRNRPPEFVDELTRVSRSVDRGYEVDEETYARIVMKYPVIRRLPIQRIPDDTTPEIEVRKARAGGCCGQASRNG